MAVNLPSAPAELSPQCAICGTALSGPLALLFRLVGVTRSVRNPNLCSRCNTHREEGRLVQLTALFADLTAFTQLTHELGPDRAYAVIDAFSQMVTTIAARHEGFVDKFVGDGVLVFFNIPIQSEQHATQAVAAGQEILAGLSELRQRFELDLAARVGIASGWARVGRVGSRDNQDYTAIGDVVNLAARLEGHAQPGEIVTDCEVYRAVATEYPDQAPEWIDLKGFPEPIEAYRLNAPPVPRGAEPAAGRRSRPSYASFGSLLFAVLGAPCAAATLLGPLAVVLGIGSLLGSASMIWVESPVRLPFLGLALLGTLANLYVLWRAHRIRQTSGANGRNLPMTRLERQRTILVAGAAILTLLVIAFEAYSSLVLMGRPTL